jgi:hypothetical protein
MDTAHHRRIADFIWNIADDVLRETEHVLLTEWARRSWGRRPSPSQPTLGRHE